MAVTTKGYTRVRLNQSALIPRRVSKPRPWGGDGRVFRGLEAEHFDIDDTIAALRNTLADFARHGSFRGREAVWQRHSLTVDSAIGAVQPLAAASFLTSYSKAGYFDAVVVPSLLERLPAVPESVCPRSLSMALLAASRLLPSDPPPSIDLAALRHTIQWMCEASRNLSDRFNVHDIVSLIGGISRMPAVYRPADESLRGVVGAMVVGATSMVGGLRAFEAANLVHNLSLLPYRDKELLGAISDRAPQLFEGDDLPRNLVLLIYAFSKLGYHRPSFMTWVHHHLHRTGAVMRFNAQDCANFFDACAKLQSLVPSEVAQALAKRVYRLETELELRHLAALIHAFSSPAVATFPRGELASFNEWLLGCCETRIQRSRHPSSHDLLSLVSSLGVAGHRRPSLFALVAARLGLPERVSSLSPSQLAIVASTYARLDLVPTFPHLLHGIESAVRQCVDHVSGGTSGDHREMGSQLQLWGNLAFAMAMAQHTHPLLLGAMLQIRFQPRHVAPKLSAAAYEGVWGPLRQLYQWSGLHGWEAAKWMTALAACKWQLRRGSDESQSVEDSLSLASLERALYVAVSYEAFQEKLTSERRGIESCESDLAFSWSGGLSTSEAAELLDSTEQTQLPTSDAMGREVEGTLGRLHALGRVEVSAHHLAGQFRLDFLVMPGRGETETNTHVGEVRWSAAEGEGARVRA